MAVLLSAVTVAEARKIVYVDGVNGNDDWDGLCEEWDGETCGPKRTIQAGIDATVNGDDVIVADAVYLGAGNFNISYHGRAITVRSKNGPADCVVSGVGIDGDAFTFESGEGPGSVLDGFTLWEWAPC
jgi:hypothetical protein